ncbi:MAG: FecR family protein [Lachnospiraceae bacterium]|nr:FecR family protein [Lachnospiraceae bacterium]
MKNPKTIIICAGSLVATLAIIILIIFFSKRQESYRIIKVFEVDGTASIEREEVKDLAPYPNMVLASGDHVTLEKGKLTLNADEDKYIYLEEGTELVLHATGNAQNSKTKIDLLRGAITNEIQNKLIGDSSYEINTPNSTMAVRGTIFYVRVYEEDGVKYTKVSVFDGKVTTRLIYKDGSVSDEEVIVGKGNEVTIYENDTKTDYVSDQTPIKFEELPPEVLKKLQMLIRQGSDVCITDEEIILILEGEGGRVLIDAGKEGLPETDSSDAAGETDDGAGNEGSGLDTGNIIPGEDSGGQDDNAGGNEGSSTGGDSNDDSQDDSKKEESSNQADSYTVTFVYKGNVFGTQSVKAGEKATEPTLKPAGSGKWQFDFGTPINGDTTITWE